MRCSHCGEEIASDAKYCKYCGKKTKLEKPISKKSEKKKEQEEPFINECPKCHKKIDVKTSFCRHCGYTYPDNVKVATPIDDIPKLDSQFFKSTGIYASLFVIVRFILQIILRIIGIKDE